MHCVAGPAVSMVAISMRLPISLPRPVARSSMAFFMGSERYTRSAAVVASSCAFSREASVDHSLNQLELLAHLADRAVDLAVDDIVDVPAPPLVGDQRLVVDVGEAGLEALARQRLDGERGSRSRRVPGRPRTRRASWPWRHRRRGTCAATRETAVRQEMARHGSTRGYLARLLNLDLDRAAPDCPPRQTDMGVTGTKYSSPT